ncbi:hypothetical protein ES703_75003 [subsurface metagenome]
MNRAAISRSVIAAVAAGDVRVGARVARSSISATAVSDTAGDDTFANSRTAANAPYSSTKGILTVASSATRVRTVPPAGMNMTVDDCETGYNAVCALTILENEGTV